jgi:hypothetical protein
VPFFGTFGAASGRVGSLGKALQDYEIGHDPCSAWPSLNRVARVHRKRHSSFR